MTDFQPNGKCKYFDGYSAPMCPMDTGAAHAAWFADEPICCLRDVPDWVKRQRKIVKTVVQATAGFFTLPMLERRFIVRKTTTGIDPDGTDTERKNAEKTWLDKHPPIKPKTDEEREKLAAWTRLQRGSSS